MYTGHLVLSQIWSRRIPQNSSEEENSTDTLSNNYWRWPKGSLPKWTKPQWQITRWLLKAFSEISGQLKRPCWQRSDGNKTTFRLISETDVWKFCWSNWTASFPCRSEHVCSLSFLLNAAIAFSNKHHTRIHTRHTHHTRTHDLFLFTEACIEIFCLLSLWRPDTTLQRHKVTSEQTVRWKWSKSGLLSFVTKWNAKRKLTVARDLLQKLFDW